MFSQSSTQNEALAGLGRLQSESQNVPTVLVSSSAMNHVSSVSENIPHNLDYKAAAVLNICIVGMGAVGIVYGFVLERSGKARVTAVCRSNYNTMTTSGVSIKSQIYGNIDGWKPSRVVGTTAEAADRQYDYVILTAKYIPDVTLTSHILGPLLSQTSTFVLIQNGIGIHEELRAAVPSAVIISACAYITGQTEDGGKYVRHGMTDRLVLGIHWPAGNIEAGVKLRSQERTETLVDIFRTGGCNAMHTDDIETARWKKNLINISYAVLCALTRASLSTLLNNKWIDTLTPVIRGFLEETSAIANVFGISITQAMIEQTEELMLSLYAQSYPGRNSPPSDFKPSILVDLESSRPMEVEGILGAIVKKGRAAGISSPRLELAYAALALLQEPLLSPETR